MIGPGPAFSVARLQAYLRTAAARLREVVPLSPFELFFDPVDPQRFFNYAIPVEPADRLSGGIIATLRAEFAQRGRRVRIEFIEEFSPALGRALEAHGLREEERHPLMLCPARSYREPPAVPGVRVQLLGRETNNATLRAFVATQQVGFEGADPRDVTKEDGENLRRKFGKGNRYFLAFDAGKPVAAGAYTGPADGLAELVGITTLPEYRGRGIATVLTAAMLQTAFASGVSAVFLSAEDERAGRVYRRVGFEPYGTSVVHGDGV